MQKGKIDKFKDLAQKEGIRLFEFTPQNDLILVKWWMHLLNSGDIDRLLNKGSHRLPEFFNIFKPPVYLFHISSPSGEILHAHWVKPTYEFKDEATVSNAFWSRSDLRGTPQQMRFSYITYRLIFCFASAIVANTWQKDMLEMHSKGGYTINGMIPNFQGRDEYYIVRLTEENFINSKAGKLGAKLIERMIE